MMGGCFHHPFGGQLHLSWQQVQVSDDSHLDLASINDVLMLQNQEMSASKNILMLQSQECHSHTCRESGISESLANISQLHIAS